MYHHSIHKKNHQATKEKKKTKKNHPATKEKRKIDFQKTPTKKRKTTTSKRKRQSTKQSPPTSSNPRKKPTNPQRPKPTARKTIDQTKTSKNNKKQQTKPKPSNNQSKTSTLQKEVLQAFFGDPFLSQNLASFVDALENKPKTALYLLLQNRNLNSLSSLTVPQLIALAKKAFMFANKC